MAEKKEQKSSTTRRANTSTQAPKGNATGLRVGAVILWIFALAFEFLAIMLLFEKLLILPKIDPVYRAIIALVPDLICVIIGSQLWKKANHIDPASQKNALKFWLWNNMGVIVSAIAFVPFIILLLNDKNADKKHKTIGTIAAVIFLAVSGLVSYDWNPLSVEAKEMAESEVYWTTYGKKMHLYKDCQALDRSVEENIHHGQPALFLEEKNDSGTVCKFCQKRYDDGNGDPIGHSVEAPAVDEALDAAVNE